MIRINGIKLAIHQKEETLSEKAAKILGIEMGAVDSVKIRRRSVDARKKPLIFRIYSLDVALKDKESEAFLIEKAQRRKKSNNIRVEAAKSIKYPNIEPGSTPLRHPPIIVGFGPAGMFAAYLLALFHYRPIVIERGEPVEERVRRVEDFWAGKGLCPDSNVSFGEGGAGTFSDGKLHTMIKDSMGRNSFVMETLVKHGASPEVCYDAKPHIGTDRLRDIVKNIRNDILAMGGRVYFNSRLESVDCRDKKVVGVWLQDGSYLPVETLILATGHSARDTMEMLYNKGLVMETKPFAVGVRIQHSQEAIDRAQYGVVNDIVLGPASYKLTKTLSNGRGVYSFCMCPGGYVVDASTEEGCLCVNGMSYHDRASGTANSALVVTVDAKDFPKTAPPPLSGIAFQRDLEKAAYREGGGKIPVQRIGDFLDGKESVLSSDRLGRFCGKTAPGRVDRVLPPVIAESIKEALVFFDKNIPGFADPDGLVAAVESRTSSPVKFLRDENLESNLKGIYPCGEGAGYAGGITSAAMDGLRVAEAIISRYRAPEEGEYNEYRQNQ